MLPLMDKTSQSSDNALQRVLDEYNATAPPDQKLTKNKWAKRAGVASSTLYAIEAGRTGAFNLRTLRKLAKAVKSTEIQLAAKLRTNFSLASQVVPLLDSQQLMGLLREPPAESGELSVVATDFSASLEPSSTLAGYKVDDNSINRWIAAGGYAIFDWTCRELRDGAYYLILHGGAFMVRRYRAQPDRFEPDSQERYETIYPQPNDRPEIVGKVLHVGTPMPR